MFELGDRVKITQGDFRGMLGEVVHVVIYEGVETLGYDVALDFGRNFSNYFTDDQVGEIK